MSETPERLDLLALGRTCVDEILELDALPAEDSKAPIRARLREGGGQASTAACAAAHLGARAAFIGVLGDDEPGGFARQRMSAFGVDLSGLPPPRSSTPLSWCLVSRATGSRTILWERLADEPLRWDEVDPGLLARARCVLVDPQAEHLIPALAEACAARGIPLVADAEHARGEWPLTWGRVDVLAVSATFLGEACPGAAPEEALRRVAERTRGTCVATLGARGAVALLDGEPVAFPAPAVSVRDSTGAGDVFHGALCLALARGAALPAALPYAVRAASLSCQGLGGRSFPALEGLGPLPGLGTGAPFG